VEAAAVRIPLPGKYDYGFEPDSWDYESDRHWRDMSVTRRWALQLMAIAAGLWLGLLLWLLSVQWR
jgi:hypothetical protein